MNGKKLYEFCAYSRFWYWFNGIFGTVCFFNTWLAAAMHLFWLAVFNWIAFLFAAFDTRMVYKKRMERDSA